jgi:hypothetical protein
LDVASTGSCSEEESISYEDLDVRKLILFFITPLLRTLNIPRAI